MNDNKLILQLCELSKISLSKEELSELGDDLQEIVTLMDKVKCFDADNCNDIRNSLEYQNLLNSANNSEEIQEEQNYSIHDNRFVVPKII